MNPTIMKKYLYNTFYNKSDEYVPRYDYWINMPFWIHYWLMSENLSEPLTLILNYEPGSKTSMYFYLSLEDKIKQINSGLSYYKDCMDYKMMRANNIVWDCPREEPIELIKLTEELDQLRHIFERALDFKELESIKIEHEEVTIYHIKPRDFIFWAKNKGLQIPGPFMVLLGDIPVNEVPPYLDPNHRYHSKELAVAIKVWEAIYGKNQLDPHKPSHRNQIEAWLQHNITDKDILKGKVIDRISTMVNVHKKRGSGLKSKRKNPTKK